MDKEQIESEMKRILLEIELSKFDLVKKETLKAEYEKLKKLYASISIQEHQECLKHK